MIRLLIVCLILGGCSTMNDLRKHYIYQTKEERFAGHRAKCTELGFNPNDVSHSNCVLRLEQSWIEAKALENAANSIWIHS
jgi:hypothetical protein